MRPYFSMQVWDLKDLGLQATQRITAASDPLHLMQEVSQNFPLLVEALSRMSVNTTLRRDVSQIQQSIPSHAQFVLINGLSYPIEDFDLYTFVDYIRREVRLYDGLLSTGVSSETIKTLHLMRGNPSEVGAQPRLDIGPQEITFWANDLEKDDTYARWPHNLESLLQPMFPGQLPMIGRNLMNAMYVFDPANPSVLELGPTVKGLVGQKWPLRFGLIPFVSQVTSFS